MNGTTGKDFHTAQIEKLNINIKGIDNRIKTLVQEIDALNSRIAKHKKQIQTHERFLLIEGN